MVQTLNSSLTADCDVDDSKPFMSWNLLASHPSRLATERSALEAVNTTAKHVECFVIVARENKLWFLTT